MPFYPNLQNNTTFVIINFAVEDPKGGGARAGPHLQEVVPLPGSDVCGQAAVAMDTGQGAAHVLSAQH